MMQRWLQRLTPVLAIFLAAPNSLLCNSPASFDLRSGEPPYAQDQKYWCWAAAPALAINTIDASADVTQCELVNAKLGRSTCCDNKKKCNVTGEASFGPDFKPKLTSTKPTGSKFLNWADVQKEIFCKRKAFVFAFLYDNSNSGHVLTAVGYETATTSANSYIIFNDSLPVGAGGKKNILYYDYKGAASSPYNHYEDYYDISRVNP